MARKQSESMEEHEWRLMTFFLYIMRKEAQRLRQDLHVTRAIQGPLVAHVRAQRLREALMPLLREALKH